jgi:putative ABC transport system substrate-binding protein
MWPGNASDSGIFQTTLVSRLQELGWTEGRTVTLVNRHAEGDRNRYDTMAKELAGAKVDAIVAPFPSAVRAARKAAPDTPIVFVFVSDPVQEGFVQSLARPGGNITGASSRDAELNGKRLQLLKTLVPRAKRVALLLDPFPKAGLLPHYQRVLEDIVRDGEGMGLRIDMFQVAAAAEVGPLFDRLVRERFDAAVALIYVSVRGEDRSALAQHAVRVRLPVVYPSPDYVVRGGLASFAQSLPEMGRSVAQYVDKVLRGTRPADLPVEEPRAFDIVINKTAANAIGLSFPASVMVAADRVIE